MEHMHTDVSVGLSTAFGAVILTLLLGAATWLGVSLVSLMADQLVAVWRVMPTAGL